jgi:hypothetical protein
MATGGFPALAIQPPASPTQQIGGALQVRNEMQRGQMQDIELQNARLQQQSNATLMRLFAQNKGDMNQTYQDAVASGQVLPEHLLDFRQKSVAAQVQAAALDEKKLQNIDKMHDIAENELEGFKALPLAQRNTAALGAIAGRLQSAGVDISKIGPVFGSLAQDPSDENIRNLEVSFKGEKWVVDNEIKQRQLASTPTVAQAQAKNAAELDKAQDEAKSAHIALLSMPSPDEAKTSRVANLLKTQAETAASFAATAKSKAETALIGTNPVIAFDPQAGQRVLTTMPQSQAKGFTNPIKASEADIQKETDATKQFNDVQMNISRYRNAITNLGGPGDTHTTEIAHILSEGKFEAGHLAGLLPGASLAAEITNQKQIATDWNKLTPEEQDAVTGYLRAKGSVIAFQKALTQTGRTSKEALAIEMQNLPVPLQAQNSALKQMDAFQENIDTASKGLTRVPWLPSPQEVRTTIENEDKNKTAQAQAAAQHFQDYRAQSGPGQYRGIPSQDTGVKRYQVGMVVEGIPGAVGKTVTKVYPDGSFDAK